MEHSRIILGEKVYKELNPTSKERKHTPNSWQTASSCPLLFLFLSHLTLLSLHLLHPLFTPPP